MYKPISHHSGGEASQTHTPKRDALPRQIPTDTNSTMAGVWIALLHRGGPATSERDRMREDERAHGLAHGAHRRRLTRLSTTQFGSRRV